MHTGQGGQAGWGQRQVPGTRPLCRREEGGGDRLGPVLGDIRSEERMERQVRQAHMDMKTDNTNCLSNFYKISCLNNIMDRCLNY